MFTNIAKYCSSIYTVQYIVNYNILLYSKQLYYIFINFYFKNKYKSIK